MARPPPSNASKSALKASSSSEELFGPDKEEAVSSSKIVFWPFDEEKEAEGERTLQTCTVTVFSDPAEAALFEGLSSSSPLFTPPANLRSKLMPFSRLESEDGEVETDTSTWRLNADVTVDAPEDVVLGDDAKKGMKLGVAPP